MKRLSIFVRHPNFSRCLWLGKILKFLWYRAVRVLKFKIRDWEDQKAIKEWEESLHKMSGVELEEENKK